MENLTDQGEDSLSVSENLDENGFPSLPFSEEEDDESAGVFASDFYSSGTDWSSLVGDSSSKKLKQTNLLQMWGIKKPQHQSNPESGVSSFPKKTNNPNPKKFSTPQPRRVCPFYKKIPGTPFSVDAFRFGLIEGCSAYFLSHFHYDHYGGLSKGWSHGPIYCTPLTARLVRMCLSVNPSYILPLELDVEHNVEGVKVTMLEANHCPGAALIHFRLRDGRCYLHTGDFRACKSMQSHPLLANHRVNLLYLDTTYCNPKYRFPSKDDVLSFVVKTAKQCLKKQPRTLIVAVSKPPLKRNIQDSHYGSLFEQEQSVRASNQRLQTSRSRVQPPAAPPPPPKTRKNPRSYCSPSTASPATATATAAETCLRCSSSSSNPETTPAFSFKAIAIAATPKLSLI